jgi:ketosteroid isomerase-like protein
MLRPSLFLASSVYLAVTFISPINLDAQSSKDEQTLLQLERDWCTATVKGDKKGLARFLADDYSAVGARGIKKTKADELALLTASPTTVCNDFDIKVRLYGDAAVVTGTGLRSGTYQGKPYADLRVYWTDTWVRRNGQWQCVASHGTWADASQK